jgi:quercetin dioxygenase-like cupin family protein
VDEQPVVVDVAQHARARLDVCPDFAVGTVEFAPGQVFAAHRHDHHDEIVVVVAGTLVVTAGGADQVLTPGSRIVLGKGGVHGLRNATDELAVLSFVKVPYVAGDTVWV